MLPIILHEFFEFLNEFRGCPKLLSKRGNSTFWRNSLMPVNYNLKGKVEIFISRRNIKRQRTQKEVQHTNAIKIK